MLYNERYKARNQAAECMAKKLKRVGWKKHQFLFLSDVVKIQIVIMVVTFVAMRSKDRKKRYSQVDKHKKHSKKLVRYNPITRQFLTFTNFHWQH